MKSDLARSSAASNECGQKDSQRDAEDHSPTRKGKREHKWLDEKGKAESAHLSKTLNSLMHKPPKGDPTPDGTLLKAGKRWPLEVLEIYAAVTSRADKTAFIWFCDESRKRGFSLDSELELIEIEKVPNSVVETRGDRFVPPFVRQSTDLKYWITNCAWQWTKRATLLKRAETPVLTDYGMKWWRSVKRPKRYMYEGVEYTLRGLAKISQVTAPTLRKRIETDGMTVEEAVTLPSPGRGRPMKSVNISDSTRRRRARRKRDENSAD